MSDDRIPLIGFYRGVGIHDSQSPRRIQRVHQDIDRVHAVDDCQELLSIAANAMFAPEARLFAAAKVEAMHALAADQRLARPAVDLDDLRAYVAGLNSQSWRSPTHYSSDFDHPENAVPREQRLPDPTPDRILEMLKNSDDQ